MIPHIVVYFLRMGQKGCRATYRWKNHTEESIKVCIRMYRIVYSAMYLVLQAH